MIQVRANAYKGNKVHPLPIGRLGERDVRTVVFEIDDLKKTYGAGTWAIIARRPEEKEDYPVKTTWESKEGYACWDVSDVDTGKCGQGLVELRYYPSDQSTDRVYKSRLWTTEIEYALGVNYGEVSPYEDIAQRIENAVSEFNSKVGDGKLSISKDGVLIGTFTANQKEDFDINIVQAQANYTETDSNSVSFIRNKPTIGNGKLTIKKDGATLASFTANATKDTTVDIIQEQANWNETDTNSVSYIQNKPFVPQDADDVGAIPMSLKGVAGGVAELGNDGYVLSSQLPSYVDDILEYSSVSDFPATGDKGKIYLSVDKSKIYRWTGSRYVEIPVGLALGETSSTAYRGDRGKIAYEYATRTHSYDELTDKPTIGSGTLTIKKDGASIGTFGANSTNNSEINIVQDQSDWNETNVNSPSYIANKPTIGTGIFRVVRNGSTVSAFNANQNIDTSFDISDFAAMRVVSQAEYDALSDIEKSSSTVWYVHDAADFETIITLSKEQYDDLPDNEKKNGLYYYVYDDSVVSPTTVVAQSLENNANSVPSSKVLYDIKTNSDSASRITETASGEIASFDDGANEYPMDSVVANIEPVQDLHGYDHPWPGGAGKNKLKNTLTSGNSNGITYTVFDDGTIKVNGTATSSVYINITQISGQTFLAGDYILNGCPAGGNANTYCLYDNGSLVDSGSGVSFTLSNPTSKRIIIRIVSGTTISDLVFKPMIRLASETDATYEPYSNICPISGWDEVKVTRTGVNLLDVTEWMARNGYTNYTIDDEGWITIPSLNEAHIYSNPYRFSQLITGSASILIDANRTTATNMRVRLYRDNTFINESTSYLDNRQFNAVAVNYGSAGKATFKLMVNIGATHMDWLPASIQNVTIPLGQTVYGGTLDVVSGVLTIDRAFVDMGTLNWTYVFGTKRHSLLRTDDLKYIIERTPSLSALADIVCNKYSRITASQANTFSSNYYGIAVSMLGVVYVRDDNYESTESDFMSTMSGVQLVYKLATPQTIQLTKQEVTSLLAKNNVWADSGEVSVVYTADMKMYIDSRIQSLIEEGT